MIARISEADWKLLRKLSVSALERFCDRVLSEVGLLAAEPGQSSHQRYLAVFKLLQKQDKKLADMFNNLRRSTALLQLALMRSRDLFTEEEFARFSPETRAILQRLFDPAEKLTEISGPGGTG
jgi:hypothetical protein